MAKKIELDVKLLNYPTECANCIERIVGDMNGVLGQFEVASNEAFQEFHDKSQLSLEETAKKTDVIVQEHFRKQELKEDEAMAAHFEKQELKHTDFFAKMEKRIDRLSTINMWLLGMFGLAITYIFVVQQKKANASDVLSTDTFRNIMKISDSYKDQRFIIRPDQKFDEDSYKMVIETLLERNQRGIKTDILEPYDDKK